MHDHPDSRHRARDDQGQHRLPVDGQAGRADRRLHGRPVRAVHQRHDGAKRHQVPGHDLRRRRPGRRSPCSSRSGQKTDWTWQVVAVRAPLVDVQPYLGQVAQFPLTTSLPVVRGETIALTTPTWAPVLSIDLSTSHFAYRQSRSRNCNHPPGDHPGAGPRSGRAPSTPVTTRARGSSTAPPRSPTRCRTRPRRPPRRPRRRLARPLAGGELRRRRYRVPAPALRGSRCRSARGGPCRRSPCPTRSRSPSCRRRWRRSAETRPTGRS